MLPMGCEIFKKKHENYITGAQLHTEYFGFTSFEDVFLKFDSIKKNEYKSKEVPHIESETRDGCQRERSNHKGARGVRGMKRNPRRNC